MQNQQPIILAAYLVLFNNSNSILKKIFILAGILFLVLLFFTGAYEKYGPTPLPFVVPKGWPQPPTNIFASNPSTREGFLLGKTLFYDGNLSRDSITSCASCHQYFAAFSTFEHSFSHGIENRFTQRNAPGLFNLAWKTSYHWDGGVNHLEVQALGPITDTNEMGETLDNLLLKLRNNPQYPPLFKAAFGDTAITTKRLLKALAQFTGNLVSAGSKYDQVKNGKDSFLPYEQKGYEIYKQYCSSCHSEPLFTNDKFSNNGLGLNKLNDLGRKRITGLSRDSLQFKIPSLRNLKLTPPYMHDGSMGYITQVINYYTVIDSSLPQLDPILKKPIRLSERNKAELLAFLFTLTDTSFTKNKNYAPGEHIIFRH